MPISDEFLLTYLIGTEKDINDYLTKNKENNSAFDLGYMIQGLLVGPVFLFSIFPPLGLVIEADFFYRIGKRMFSKKYGSIEAPGLTGRVRELYKALKS